MGLALCHRFPRDGVVQVGLFFLLASCILQAILIGSHDKEKGGGSIVPVDRIIGVDDVVHIGALPAVYVGDGNAICLWSADFDLISVECARFVEAFHAVIGLFLSCFIVSVVSLLFAVFFIVPISRTTTFMLTGMLLALFLPITLHTAAIGVFFHQCKRYANEIASRLVFFGAEVEFRREYMANVAIGSEACLAAGFLILFVRFLLSVIYRQSIKQRDIVRRDIGKFMRRHLVNDDWERQKAVLQSHARSVQLEIVRCEGDTEETQAKGGVGDTNNGLLGQNGDSEFTFRPSPAHSSVVVEVAKGTGVSLISSEPYHPTTHEQ
ncbi:hypothetical protein MOQ_003715 [Trypanosoma cruzi marinkellei]|uniref:Uncharacterized protein n=1 Tax=Trypanosoma cruzi marinkellei TaxID=85056 RepID=K2MZB9_TRYCR|nr:hypothetical protein MOQ_003715 [Trypanosoma cruzi marinkellei]